MYIKIDTEWTNLLGEKKTLCLLHYYKRVLSKELQSQAMNTSRHAMYIQILQTSYSEFSAGSSLYNMTSISLRSP